MPDHIVAASIEIPCSKLQGIFDRVEVFFVPAALPLDFNMFFGFGTSDFYNLGASVFRACGFRNP